LARTQVDTLGPLVQSKRRGEEKRRGNKKRENSPPLAAPRATARVFEPLK